MKTRSSFRRIKASAKPELVLPVRTDGPARVSRLLCSGWCGLRLVRENQRRCKPHQFRKYGCRKAPYPAKARACNVLWGRASALSRMDLRSTSDHETPETDLWGRGFCPAAELLLGVPGGGCDFKSARIDGFSMVQPGFRPAGPR